MQSTTLADCPICNQELPDTVNVLAIKERQRFSGPVGAAIVGGAGPLSLAALVIEAKPKILTCCTCGLHEGHCYPGRAAQAENKLIDGGVGQADTP
jgi:hypothetical protein